MMIVMIKVRQKMGHTYLNFSPRDAGLITWNPTLNDPADPPKTVMESGSPPNAPMLVFTQRRARFWSHSPKLPGTVSSPEDRKPKASRRYWMTTTMTSFPRRAPMACIKKLYPDRTLFHG